MSRIELKVGATHTMGWRDVVGSETNVGSVAQAPDHVPEWHTGDEAVAAIAVDERGFVTITAAAAGETQVQVKVTNTDGQMHAESVDIAVVA